MPFQEVELLRMPAKKTYLMIPSQPLANAETSFSPVSWPEPLQPAPDVSSEMLELRTTQLRLNLVDRTLAFVFWFGNPHRHGFDAWLVRRMTSQNLGVEFVKIAAPSQRPGVECYQFQQHQAP